MTVGCTVDCVACIFTVPLYINTSDLFTFAVGVRPQMQFVATENLPEASFMGPKNKKETFFLLACLFKILSET